MPIIHLRHPAHGSKIASIEAEAVNDEVHGWFRYDPCVPDPVETPVNGVEEVLTETPPPVYNEIVPPTAKAVTMKKGK